MRVFAEYKAKAVSLKMVPARNFVFSPVELSADIICVYPDESTIYCSRKQKIYLFLMLVCA